MRKLLSLILAVALLLFAFSAFAEGRGGTPPGDPPSGEMGTPPDGGGFGGGTPPGGSTSSFEYAAATEITEAAEQTDQSYESDTADESALIVNTTDAVTIINPMVTKTGDSDGGDNCNFYGLNAGVLVMGGSTTTISGGTVETSASGANGVFSYGGNGGQRHIRLHNDRRKPDQPERTYVSRNEYPCGHYSERCEPRQ